MAQENNELNPQIEELQKRVDEYLNNWKRERADFINYKKEESERFLSLVNFTKEKFVVNLLPVLDNLYLAQAHLKDNGLAQVIKQFEEFLKKEGIESIETEGKIFDVNFMEIVAEVESSKDSESIKSGFVAEQVQRGYMMGEKLLRPAKVKILK